MSVAVEHILRVTKACNFYRLPGVQFVAHYAGWFFRWLMNGKHPVDRRRDKHHETALLSPTLNFPINIRDTSTSDDGPKNNYTRINF